MTNAPQVNDGVTTSADTVESNVSTVLQPNEGQPVDHNDASQESVGSDSKRRTWHRLNHALGPIAAGMIIDTVDFVTYGPVGLVLGLPVGGLAGYWLGRSMRLENHMCWICSVAAGIYCSIPGTELLPLGTLVGALVRFQDEPQNG